MRISKVWIGDFLEKKGIEGKEVAKRLSSTLAEVEAVEEKGEFIGPKIVIAKITELSPHPNADKLQVAQVLAGKKTYQVVCGATNIKPSQIVPLVLPGGRVKNPEGEVVVVKRARIRGVESEAMMCSQLELEAGEDHSGIWILPKEWEKYLGKPLLEVLPEIKDTIWEIENKALTHRPDCFGQLGMAREIAAALNLKFKPPSWYQGWQQKSWQPKTTHSKIDLTVAVEDSFLCPRYSAIAVDKVKIAPSPPWLQQRLLSAGLRPINNIVDITNYVMMELGQPLHAFDAAKVVGQKIIVRRAKKGEVIKTLDGEERRLSEEDLVIADKKGPIAVAGVMGGLNSEVDEQTTTVILESANFQRAGIRRSAMRLGIRSEASLRFEKGLDPNLTLIGLRRAGELILKLCPTARIVSPLVDFYPKPLLPQTIKTTPGFINQVLGTQIPPKKMLTILTGLGLQASLKQEKLVVKIPTFRQDLSLPEDLAEEVGRIWGYEKLPPALPQKDLTPAPISKDAQLDKKIREILVALGFDEIYTYAFVGERLYRRCRLDPKDLIPLQNPLSPDLAFLKNSAAPSLIEKAALNFPNFENFSLFEITRVFHYQKNKKALPDQPKMIAGLEVVRNQREDSLFLITKGKLEELFRRILVKKLNFKPISRIPYLHPGKSSEILSGSKSLGIFGVIHPLVAAEFSLSKASVCIFEVNFEILKQVVGGQIDYSPPLLQTPIKIDLDVKASSWQEAEEKLKRIFGRYLIEVKFINLYRGRYNVRVWLLPGRKTSGENLQKLIRKVVA